MFIIIVFWLGSDRRRDFFFFVPDLLFFRTHASLLTLFACFFILFHPCCSHPRVFEKTLVHEFPMSYSHTEWSLHFRETTGSKFSKSRLSETNYNNNSDCTTDFSVSCLYFTFPVALMFSFITLLVTFPLLAYCVAPACSTDPNLLSALAPYVSARVGEEPRLL